MKKMIILVVSIIIFVLLSIFILMKSNDGSSVTYIKIDTNNKVMIGLNEDNKVIIFNNLDNKIKGLNISSYLNQKLDVFMDRYIKKVNELELLPGREIYITLMTKNPDKIEYLYNIIDNSLSDDYQIIQVVPTENEMLSYSNEISYDIDRVFTDDKINDVSDIIMSSLNNYIEGKMESLTLDKIVPEARYEYLIGKRDEGYFNDFDIVNYGIENYDIKMLESSNYVIDITEDGSYKLEVVLHFEYHRLNENILEEYMCTINNNLKIKGIYYHY